MKVYELVLFLFVFNVVLSILMQLDLGFETKIQTGGSESSPWKNYTEELMSKVNSTDIQSTSSANWFFESIRLVIQSIPIFTKAVIYATVGFPWLVKSYFSMWGLSEEQIAPIATGISAAVYLVYAIAVIQFVSGRQVE